MSYLTNLFLHKKLKFLKNTLLFLFISASLPLCSQVKNAGPISQSSYIEGFSLEQKEGYWVLGLSHIDNKNNNTDSKLLNSYTLVHRDSIALKNKLSKTHKNIILIPVERIVVSATTHLPAIELLGSQDVVIGFPGTKYISSRVFREKVKNGTLKELGSEGDINIELLLEATPELLIGYSVGEEPKEYQTIRNAGIPVLINSDWLSKYPLGKASWIYFFGALLNKLDQADIIFSHIVAEYNKAKQLAKKANNTPTVMSGAMYEDIWYAPGGNSWGAQFIKDANASYVFKSSSIGSDTYSLEYVLSHSLNATYWIGPAQFTSYSEMTQNSVHYKQFKSFKNNKIYTFAAKKGSTGGVLYYELAPQRPDLVLKDLISILHPELLPHYSSSFFTKLDE
jgi:iron complex transport system substrate-binding protein